MTAVTPTGIEIDRVFAAPPTAVFDAWTTPQHFARWFGGKDAQVPLDSLDFVAEPGRTWTARMVLPDGHTIDWTGDFVEVTPVERLVFTITDRPAEPSRAKVVVELKAIADGTHMHFTQETPGFTPEQQQAVLAGWQSFIDELELIATE
ncbi:MAG: SRPBCC domain-containing protein [Acidobacteriota bacterium]|nr:SRPBCC domain-containing protein [Acidobacteriota bacterium]MDE3093550.1 SRPBCC domain-containing protein [Acidobacteriota bacterium]MDE3140102.1 SRPBCC domain-containing protein [Acidobacteriota bacterium]MDE3147195.1 SRPBCC domain-containing protein [Acidobacteriota bacterium]